MSLTDKTVKQLRGVFDTNDNFLGVLGAGKKKGLIQSTSRGGELLSERMRRYSLQNPLVLSDATGVTVGNTNAPSATATVVFNDLNTGNVTSRQGADFYVAFSTQMYVMGAVQADPPNLTAPFSRSNGAIGLQFFRTASPEVEIVCGSSASATARIRVMIDEGDGFKYTDKVGYAAQTAGKTYLNLSFGDTTPKERVFAVEHILNVSFEGVRVRTNHTVTPAEQDRPVIAVNGDSTVELTVGDSGTFTRAAVWQSILRDLSGCDVRGFGIGGTGIAAPGSFIPMSNDRRIQQVIDLNCRAAIWHCSTNDVAQTQAALRAATHKIIDRVRAAKGPEFPMVWLGMYGGGNTGNAAHVNVETWVLNAVRERIAAGDDYLKVRPHLTASNPISTALTIGSDANHNTVNGYRQIGRRIYRDIRSAFDEMSV